LIWPVLASIATALIASRALCCEREQRQMACTLHGDSQAPLVFGTSARLTARTNFGPVCQIAPKHVGIFIGNFFDLVEAEIADFAAARAKAPTRATRAAETAAPSATTTPAATIIKIVHIAIIIAHSVTSL
jgi:hypothetical protein